MVAIMRVEVASMLYGMLIVLMGTTGEYLDSVFVV